MIEFNNLTDYNLPIEELRALAEKAISENKKLSVAFLSSSEISDLNRRYRKKEGPTDVLSFEGENDFLGEVLISPEIVKKRARENELSFESEIRRVLIHGILHLTGYDHQTEKEKKEMRKKEKELLSG